MRFRRIKIYRQLDSKDCGPTCIRIIANYYGVVLKPAEIRSKSATTKLGSTFQGLSNAAIEIGFDAVPTSIPFNVLIEDAPTPCILHWDSDHFVVLLPGSSENKIRIGNPADGRTTVFNKANFKSHWLEKGRQDGNVLLLQPTPELYKSEQFNEGSAEMSWFRIFYSKYKQYFFQIFLCLCITTFLQTSLPFLTQLIVDVGIEDQNLSFVELIISAQIILITGRILTEFLRTRILLHLSTHVNFALLSSFWLKLSLLPISFFDSRRTGDIYQRIIDHKRIETFITGPILNTAFSLFSLIISSFYLLYYSQAIFIIYVISGILYFLYIRLFLKIRRDLDNKKFSISSRENNITVQFIQGMQDIKMNGAEYIRRAEWNTIQAHVFKMNFKFLTIGQYQQIGSLILNEGKNVLIMFLVVKSVMAGEISLGVMLSIQFLIGQISGPMEQVTLFSQQLQEARLSLARLNSIHELENEEQPGAITYNPLLQSATISLRKVSFQYDQFSEKVLENIDLTIPENKVTAIVGASGSGKTTILKLLLNFYQHYTGDIFIGKINLKNLSPKSWRSHCGVIMQEGYIYSDTIGRNIAVNEVQPDHDRLLHACYVANITELIQKMPKGFETQIGADGHGLSLGQKQRILIARAVYKNPKFLFMDEATNSLDANNEMVIMLHLNEFFSDRTVLIVAHRLSTIRNADNIVVIGDNGILEMGTHDELLNAKGAYYTLVKNQLELVE